MENFRTEIDSEVSSVVFVFGFGGNIVMNESAEAKEQHEEMVQAIFMPE